MRHGGHGRCALISDVERHDRDPKIPMKNMDIPQERISERTGR